MATTETVGLYDALLKELYPQKRVENLAARNRVFLSKVKKSDGFYGDQAIVPIVYAYGGGRSATASTSFAGNSGTSKVKLVVTRVKDYNSIQLDGELIHASSNNMGAFISATKLEVDMMLDAMGKSLSHALYGNGGGAIGRRASIAGEVITLETADDAKNFHKNMVLKAGTTDGSTAATVRAGSATVASVDEDAGTVTLATGGAAAITGFANNDYLFAEGDISTTTGLGLKLKGLAAWLPLTAPSGGDSFFGIDRSVDPVRLAGTRVNDTSASLEENILRTAEKVHSRGGKPDACFINHTNFTKLVLGREAKVVTESGGESTLGFKGFPVDYSGGTLMVYPDPECQNNRGYLLTMSSWEVMHLKGVPHIINDDGLRALRMAAEDSIQVRSRFMGQLVCRAPGWNGVFAI